MATAVLVAELRVGRMMHRPHERETIGPGRQLWQVFAEANAAQARLRSAIVAANTLGRVRLGIERLVLRGPTGLKDEDHGLGPSRQCSRAARGLRFEPQQIGQAGPQQTQSADLQQMTAAEKKSTDDVPPEEPSLNQGMHHQQVQDRNFEVKLLALQRGRQEYDTSLQQLNEKIDRYDRIAQDWQSRLKQEQELTSQQNVAKVVSQLEQVTPEVGKEQLKMWIAEKKMDDAILLMSRMSESKLSKILKTFETPEELAKLHEIHERIIGGSADNSKLEKALGELNAVDGKK